MGLLDLKQIKCKTCGEPLHLNNANNGVIKCGVCDSCFTLPKFTAEQKVLDYLFQAEGDLDTGKFDDAYTKFAKAAELDKTEPEAYWGMALAEYKIQYLKDEVNNRLQPICHEINDKDFTDSLNYFRALKYATEAQRAVYERKGEEIDRIKKEFYKIKQTGLDYDCFICVKVSDENGERTADSEFAHRIYRMLKNNSYEPFYSEAVLKNVTGADYEAHILYALATSETMLVICFDEAYLRTKWVKNEYTRFLKLVNDEEKESDSITLVYKGKPIEKLPGKNGKIQGIDVSELDCSHRILQFVESHTPEAKRKREEAIRKREEEAKRKDKENEELRKKLAELEDKLKNQPQQTLSDEELLERMERARKERERKEAERKAAEEKEREEQKRIARDFEIENGVLKRYKGKDTRVAIPKSVTSIGESAFQECRELTYITIPNSVTSICENAFAFCSGLTSITIPNSVTSIGYNAFNACIGIENITVESENREYKSENNCLISKDGKTLILGCKNSVIPNNVVNIDDLAFAHCELTSITIPNSIASIGVLAFGGCCCLESITVENGNTEYKSENNCLLTIDGKILILGCKNSVIPNGVISIGEGAFAFCVELISINIPNSVTSIGDCAFVGCSEIKNINYAGTKRQWQAIEKVVEWDSETPDYTVRCTDGDLTKDEQYCINSDFEIESGVLKKYKGKDTKVVIPNGVKSIDNYVFCDCGLESVTLPNSVTIIGEGAFGWCSELISINYVGTKRQWLDIKKVSLWDCLTSDYIVHCTDGDLTKKEARITLNNAHDFEIEKGILKKYKGNDTQVVIPNSVTCIGEEAFFDCGLTSITIPNSVTSIDDFAFCGCRGLTSIMIPNRESISDLHPTISY